MEFYYFENILVGRGFVNLQVTNTPLLRIIHKFFAAHKTIRLTIKNLVHLIRDYIERKNSLFGVFLLNFISSYSNSQYKTRQ